MSERVDIAERIAPHFPLGRGLLTIEVVSGATGQWLDESRANEPAAVATVRMIVWEHDQASGNKTVRDIKEQELYMGWPAHYQDEQRVEAFFQALDAVITELGERAPDVVDTLMPMDLLHPEVLALRKANSSDDFHAALMTKGRFGRLFSR